jgi:hypothetical protein
VYPFIDDPATSTPPRESITDHLLGSATTSSTNTEVQLVKYVVQVMSTRWFQKWVVCVLVDDDGMTLLYYDRSQALGMKLGEDALPFIKMTSSLTLATGIEFGLDTILQKDAEVGTRQPGSHKFRYLDSGIVEDDGYRDENCVPHVKLSESYKIRINTAGRMHRQFTLFERDRRKEVVEAGHVEDGWYDLTSEGVELVLKLSHQVVSRILEPEIIQLARTVNPVLTPALLALRRYTYEKRVFLLPVLHRHRLAWNLEGTDFMDIIRQGVVCKSPAVSATNCQWLD